MSTILTHENISGYKFWVCHLLFWGFDIVLEDAIKWHCFNVDILVSISIYDIKVARSSMSLILIHVERFLAPLLGLSPFLEFDMVFVDFPSNFFFPSSSFGFVGIFTVFIVLLKFPWLLWHPQFVKFELLFDAEIPWLVLPSYGFVTMQVICILSKNIS